MPLTSEDCRADASLRDGRPLHIRGIRPDDSAALLAEFHRLSPTSVRTRFFSSKKEMSAAELRYFTDVDFSDHVALIAELPESTGPRPVGVGRMVRTNQPDHAEVALTVAEGLHGLGIGTALFTHLAKLAPSVGLRYLDASVLEENIDMLDLFRHSGFPVRTESDAGTVTLTLDIGGR